MKKNILVLVLACLVLAALWIYKNPEQAQQYKTEILAKITAEKAADEPVAKMEYVEETRTLSSEEVEFFKLVNSATAEQIIAQLTTKKIVMRDARNNSILHHLMTRKDFLTAYKVMEVLFQNNVEVNALNNYNQTPLHIAAIKNRYQLLPLLLQNGADYTLRDIQNKRALDYGAKMGHMLVIDMLKDLK